jgi:hypothetical protein
MYHCSGESHFKQQNYQLKWKKIPLNGPRKGYFIEKKLKQGSKACFDHSWEGQGIALIFYCSKYSQMNICFGVANQCQEQENLQIWNLWIWSLTVNTEQLGNPTIQANLPSDDKVKMKHDLNAVIAIEIHAYCLLGWCAYLCCGELLYWTLCIIINSFLFFNTRKILPVCIQIILWFHWWYRLLLYCYSTLRSMICLNRKTANSLLMFTYSQCVS